MKNFLLMLFSSFFLLSCGFNDGKINEVSKIDNPVKSQNLNNVEIDYFKIDLNGVLNTDIQIGKRYSMFKEKHNSFQFKYDSMLLLDYIEIPIQNQDTLTYYLGITNDIIKSILFYDKRIDFNGLSPKDSVSKLLLKHPNVKINYDNDLNMEFFRTKNKKIMFYVDSKNGELIGKYKNDNLLNSKGFNKDGFIDFIVITH